MQLDKNNDSYPLIKNTVSTKFILPLVEFILHTLYFKLMQVILMRVIALDPRLKLNEFVYLQLVLLLEAPSALLFLEGVGY